jgi:hypothetical protein
MQASCRHKPFVNAHTNAISSAQVTRRKYVQEARIPGEDNARMSKRLHVVIGVTSMQVTSNKDIYIYIYIRGCHSWTACYVCAALLLLLRSVPWSGLSRGRHQRDRCLFQHCTPRITSVTCCRQPLQHSRMKQLICLNAATPSHCGRWPAPRSAVQMLHM